MKVVCKECIMKSVTQRINHEGFIVKGVIQRVYHKSYIVKSVLHWVYHKCITNDFSRRVYH